MYRERVWRKNKCFPEDEPSLLEEAGPANNVIPLDERVSGAAACPILAYKPYCWCLLLLAGFSFEAMPYVKFSCLLKWSCNTLCCKPWQKSTAASISEFVWTLCYCEMNSLYFKSCVEWTIPTQWNLWQQSSVSSTKCGSNPKFLNVRGLVK